MKGRLGLATARIPQADRHGLMWIGRGNLYVESGTLRFRSAGSEHLPPGDYAIPFQVLNCVLLEPGTTVTHDAMRILARHGTGLVALAEDGVRFYASMPAGPDRSALARRHATAWAKADERVRVARLMYAWRLGEVLPATDLDVLRGMEGARMKRTYQRAAEQFSISWQGRRYDRSNPQGDDIPNQALNHAATAVYAAAEVAVAVSGAIPQLGFIHEDSGISFCLDIADLYRDEITIPVAFNAARRCADESVPDVERVVRRTAGRVFRREKLVSRMIERIKEVFNADDGHRDA